MMVSIKRGGITQTTLRQPSMTMRLVTSLGMPTAPRGVNHNWEGTSNGAEGDMLNEILRKVKEAGFVIKNIVTDKDSSGNAIFCNHFPEGTITYCSNHSAKTMHKDLLKIKQAKCNVSP